MTVAKISSPAPATDVVVGRVYCLPVVCELPGPVADPTGDPTW